MTAPGWERLSLDESKGHRPPDYVLLPLGSSSHFMLKSTCHKESEEGSVRPAGKVVLRLPFLNPQLAQPRVECSGRQEAVRLPISTLFLSESKYMLQRVFLIDLEVCLISPSGVSQGLCLFIPEPQCFSTEAGVIRNER